MSSANTRRPGVDLSIAIPSWNTEDLLDQCLESVMGHADDLRVEVIVVDNASDDGSCSMVSAKYPGVKLMCNRTNVGFAAACNLAIKQSTGRYVLLLNSDTIVLGGALTGLVRFMDDHSDAGVAGCRLLNRDGSLQRSCSCFPGLLTELFDALYLSKLFPRSKVFACYPMTYCDFDHVREVDFAGGSCLIVRRDAISEVGLMDEEYFMYVEEADWCYRFWEEGWAVYFYPDAEVVHLGGGSAQKYGSEIHLNLYTGRNRFIRKYRGRTAAFAHRLIVALGASLRLPVYGVAWLAGAKVSSGIALQTRVLQWALFGCKPGYMCPCKEGPHCESA